MYLNQKWRDLLPFSMKVQISFRFINLFKLGIFSSDTRNMRTHLINRMTAIVLSLALGFTPVIYAKEDKSAIVHRDSVEFKKNLAEVIFESTKSIQQISVLLRLAGASDEAVRKIQSKMTSKIGNSTTLPKLQLKDGQVLVEGKNSGIKVTSYSPLELSYRGKNWRFNYNAAPDKNFEDLLIFFGNSRKFSFLNLLVNDANAAEQTDYQKENDVKGVSAGVGLGLAGSLITVGYIVGSAGLMVSGPIVAVVVALGGPAIYGAYKRRHKVAQEERSVEDQILSSNVNFICDKNFVDFEIKYGSGVATIHIIRNSKPEKIEVFDKDNDPIPISDISDELRQKIAMLMKDCKNADDAKKWRAQWLKEIQPVALINTKPTPVQRPPSDTVKQKAAK